MAQEYRKNHTASVCYLQGFEGKNGRVQVEHLRSGVQAPARPEAIGYINNFWGVDEDVRRRAEKRAGEIEMAAAPLLSTLPETWPLEHGSEERLAILRFIALPPGAFAPLAGATRHPGGPLDRSAPGGVEGSARRVLRSVS